MQELRHAYTQIYMYECTCSTYIQYEPKYMCRNFYVHMYTIPETQYQNFKNLNVHLSRMNTIVPSSTAKLQTSVIFMGYGTKIITSSSKSLRHPYNIDYFHMYKEPRRNLYMKNTIYDYPSVPTERVLCRSHTVIVPMS
jgi:hypothetical protein